MGVAADARYREVCLMSGEYRDHWIECKPDVITVRGYYFPWGTKHIPYSSIRSVRHVKLGAVRGKWRIWGTGNPRYWLNLDPGRPKKQVGLILDLGRYVHPFITPDDPDKVEAAIRDRANLGPSDESGGPSPVV
jgi:hypothetical protein